MDVPSKLKKISDEINEIKKINEITESFAFEINELTDQLCELDIAINDLFKIRPVNLLHLDKGLNALSSSIKPIHNIILECTKPPTKGCLLLFQHDKTKDIDGKLKEFSNQIDNYLELFRTEFIKLNHKNPYLINTKDDIGFGELLNKVYDKISNLCKVTYKSTLYFIKSVKHWNEDESYNLDEFSKSNSKSFLGFLGFIYDEINANNAIHQNLAYHLYFEYPPLGTLRNVLHNIRSSTKEQETRGTASQYSNLYINIAKQIAEACSFVHKNNFKINVINTDRFYVTQFNGSDNIHVKFMALFLSSSLDTSGSSYAQVFEENSSYYKYLSMVRISFTLPPFHLFTYVHINLSLYFTGKSARSYLRS